MAEMKITMVSFNTTHSSVGKSGPGSIDSGLEGMTSSSDKQWEDRAVEVKEHQGCDIMTSDYRNQPGVICSNNASVPAAEEEEQVSFGTPLKAQEVSVQVGSEIGAERKQQREEEVLVGEINTMNCSRKVTQQSQVLQSSSLECSEIQDDRTDFRRISAKRVKERTQFFPGFRPYSSPPPPYDSQAYVFCGNSPVPVSGPPFHQGYVTNANVMMPLTKNVEQYNWHGGLTGVVKGNPFDVRNTDVAGGGASKGFYGTYGSPLSWPLSGAMSLDMFKTYGNDFKNRFSVKVFLGGLPPDIDEDGIADSFQLFSPFVVDWPQKNARKSSFPPKGFAFLLFKHQISIKKLMSCCNERNGRLFWPVSSTSIKDKLVEVRVWRLAHAEFVLDPTTPVDSRTTVFIGGIPRPLTAVELAEIMTNLYGRVCYASIDVDKKYQYPRGYGRVMFSYVSSYIAAISQRHVLIQHNDVCKRLEIKPFLLDNQSCDQCRVGLYHRPAIGFCANVSCLQYLCEICWMFLHSQPGNEHHIPLRKTSAFVTPQNSSTMRFRGKFPMASSSQSIANSKQY